MKFIGTICIPEDPDGIDRNAWVELIGKHARLTVPEPVQRINPFTRQPMTIRAPSGTAHVVIGGTKVGVMSWSEDESNLIVVCGDRNAVEPIAKAVAQLLSGRYIPEQE